MFLTCPSWTALLQTIAHFHFKQSYQGGDSDTLGHNNPRGQVHFQEREENELSTAGLFLETGVWAFEDMSVGDVFLGSRT